MTAFEVRFFCVAPSDWTAEKCRAWVSEQLTEREAATVDVRTAGRGSGAAFQPVDYLTERARDQQVINWLRFGKPKP